MYQWAILVVAYILVTWLTDAYFMGDTWIYVNDVVKAQTLGETFWDFGHPLWRPLGWLVAKITSPVSHALGLDAATNVTMALLAINWVAGLLSLALVFLLAARFSTRKWVPYLVAATFLFSNAILNYSQTAQPYVPGIALMIFGLYTLVRSESTAGSWRRSVLVGTALAVGVCQWLPLGLSLPAIALSPIFLFGFNKARLRELFQVAGVCSLALLIIFVLMAINLGIQDAVAFKAWVGSSSHGVLPDAPLKAIQRMVFALARNLVNMGNDGRLFKRYIVGDPFSPVSLSDLLRLSLWKLVLFYVFLGSVLLNLLFFKLGRRVFALVFLNAIPLLLFAVFLFESGSIDRYLPLFPILLLALSMSLGSETSRRWNRWIASVFVAVLVVSNVGAMAKVTLDRQQESVALRIRELAPKLRSPSRVITVNQQDEVYAFNQNFPFNPINRYGHLGVDMLVDPGTTQIDRWKQIFATKTLALWENQGDLWITKRVKSDRPKPEWNWVEGDDPRISWQQIHELFFQLETGDSAGGDDGFVLVLPSSANKELLGSWARENNAQIGH